MTESLRLLSIGAHPADIFDQSGGTMAHHVSRGDDVRCVVLTHGARVHDAVISDGMFHREEVPDGAELQELMQERSDVKAAEVRAACAILGVEEIYFFGADDSVLLVKDETVRCLARLLREIRPDIVLTHFPKEGDGLTNAHATAGQIVMHAIGWPTASIPVIEIPLTGSRRSFILGEAVRGFPGRSGTPRGATTTMSSSISLML